MSHLPSRVRPIELAHVSRWLSFGISVLGLEGAEGPGAERREYDLKTIGKWLEELRRIAP